ncbi:MAG: ABC transporter ATP-binding protein [Peptococcaceae bacterium]|jgi:putative ABC transport system ATP-binding protein|nr:ABC transporter ATP-binding protein [Peptococcaceae bacterium]
MIELQSVYKIYFPGSENEVRALDGIDLRVEEGEFVAIVGKSGSGKSTCMNIIGCLDVPTSGQYLIDGISVSNLSEDDLARLRNKTLGFIFQQYNLISKLSVEENVELPMLYGGIPQEERKTRITQALERVGLAERRHHYPNQLSGGQQQRVSIARALASRPHIMLADEPTGALDSKTSMEILSLLQELNQEGNTIVLITHDNYIASFAQRIIRIQDGKIISDQKNTPQQEKPEKIKTSEQEAIADGH